MYIYSIQIVIKEETPPRDKLMEEDYAQPWVPGKGGDGDGDGRQETRGLQG